MIATQRTAFFSGASLATLAVCFDALESRGMVSSNADRELILFIFAYFFVTGLVFVIGVRNLFPSALKTRIPLVYFPTNREGWTLLLSCWGRMVVWFCGAAVVGVVSSAI